MQERGIPFAPGYETGHFGKGGLREDQPVEGRIDNVAQRSGQYDGYTDDHADRGLTPDQAADIPPDGHNGHNAEETEEEFSEIATEFHAVCRAPVLDKPDVEPLSEDRDGFVEGHVCFDTDFDDLIKDQQPYNEQHHKKALFSIGFHRCIISGWASPSPPEGAATQQDEWGGRPPGAKIRKADHLSPLQAGGVARWPAVFSRIDVR